MLPQNATLVGRAELPGVGPAVIKVAGSRALDISAAFATMRDLCEASDPAASVEAASGNDVGAVDDLVANADPQLRDKRRPWLLAPTDLQAIKAAGVTFVVSMLERVIEERTRGNPAAAAAIRGDIERLVGSDLRKLKPGSAEAAQLKETLIKAGAWSQYLEVGIGPDAEIFTKSQPMSAVGTRMEIGIHPNSSWNNPEPEVVLVVSSKGRIVGATLGNDVNLRDVEGRSALLLGKAKDNNASTAIGPLIRLFDSSFTLDHVRKLDLSLTVEGADGFRLDGHSSIAEISRDPADIVGQAINAHHCYPDGLVVYLGTMFAPVKDRGEQGRGFTHQLGDLVTIATPALGALVNRVVHTDTAAPWVFGAAELMRNLARRGLLR